ncbi:MAG: hypothetical protein ABW048_08445 [Sphingobium sp.]
MSFSSWLALLALTIASAPSQDKRDVPAPPPPGVVMPQLESLSEADMRPILATAQYCLLRRDSVAILAATDHGHYAIIRRNGLQSFEFQGLTPVRRGGQFAPSPATMMIHISTDPREADVAPGQARRATVLVVGGDGGAGSFTGSYSCNY